ncbi:MAG: hypothetical protein ACO3NK_08730 [Prochlorotrichaceae cyanobacterium]
MKIPPRTKKLLREAIARYQAMKQKRSAAQIKSDRPAVSPRTIAPNKINAVSIQ